MLIQLAPPREHLHINFTKDEVVRHDIQRVEFIPSDDMPVVNTFHTLPAGDDSEETLEQAKKRISLRYDAMERLGTRLVNGLLPSLVVSGPPGLGKTHTLDLCIQASARRRHDGVTPIISVADWEADGGNAEFVDSYKWYDHISGSCSAPALYQSLWHMKHGGVLLLDDCDKVFHDEEALNLLKIATDSSKKRLLSWRKQSSWLTNYQIDRTFEFKGHIAFLTNIDFEKEVLKSNKFTEHFKALIDRAHYLCLTLRTQRDFMIRIRQVALEQQMLGRDYNLDDRQAEDLIAYVEEHKMRFYNLSLRLVGQIAQTMAADPDNWRKDIEATKMKTGI